MSNVTPIRPGPNPPERPESADNKLLESALSLLRVAVSSIDDVGVIEFAELSDVGEVVRLASERIAAWLGTVCADMDEQAAFDALDACTAVGALLDAGIDPRNGKTISPIRGVLSLAIARLDEFLGEEPDDGPGEALEDAEPA